MTRREYERRNHTTLSERVDKSTRNRNVRMSKERRMFWLICLIASIAFLCFNLVKDIRYKAEGTYSATVVTDSYVQERTIYFGKSKTHAYIYYVSYKDQNGNPVISNYISSSSHQRRGDVVQVYSDDEDQYMTRIFLTYSTICSVSIVWIFIDDKFRKSRI